MLPYMNYATKCKNFIAPFCWALKLLSSAWWQLHFDFTSTKLLKWKEKLLILFTKKKKKNLFDRFRKINCNFFYSVFSSFQSARIHGIIIIIIISSFKMNEESRASWKAKKNRWQIDLFELHIHSLLLYVKKGIHGQISCFPSRKTLMAPHCFLFFLYFFYCILKSRD